MDLHVSIDLYGIYWVIFLKLLLRYILDENTRKEHAWFQIKNQSFFYYYSYLVFGC